MATENVWGTTVPTLSDGGDTGAITVGVEWYTDRSGGGYLVGVRFYKDANNTGTHQWGLWNDAGGTTALTSGTITGETSSGWQEYSIPTPYAVAQNTRYVLGVFCPNGHYSVDSHQGVDPDDPYCYTTEATGGNTYWRSTNVLFPTHASPQHDSLVYYNGNYTYAAGLAKPTSQYWSSNYWVDVIFSDTAPAGSGWPIDYKVAIGP